MSISLLYAAKAFSAKHAPFNILAVPHAEAQTMGWV
jgi:hypothetical protein